MRLCMAKAKFPLWLTHTQSRVQINIEITVQVVSLELCPVSFVQVTNKWLGYIRLG